VSKHILTLLLRNTRLQPNTMKFFPVRRRGTKEGFIALSQPDAPDSDLLDHEISNPAENATSNIDASTLGTGEEKELSAKKRNILSRINSITTTKTHKSMVDPLPPDPTDEAFSPHKDDTFETASTTSTNSSHKEADITVESRKEDHFETISTASETTDPSTDEQLNHSVVISVVDSGSPTSTSASSSEEIEASPEKLLPPPEMLQTSPEMPQPSPEVPQPSPEMLQPSPEMLQPSPEMHQPSPERLQPSPAGKMYASPVRDESSSPKASLATTDNAPEPIYSRDILSEEKLKFHTPARRIVFSSVYDRYDDTSIVQGCGAPGGDRTNHEFGEAESLRDGSTTYEYVESEVGESITESAVDESFYTIDGADTFLSDDTVESLSFDRKDRDWDLPEKTPKFVKDLAFALQDMLDDIGQCSSYTVKQAKEVAWVEAMEARATEAVKQAKEVAWVEAMEARAAEAVKQAKEVAWVEAMEARAAEAVKQAKEMPWVEAMETRAVEAWREIKSHASSSASTQRDRSRER
jgi:hypothetical protein